MSFNRTLNSVYMFPLHPRCLVNEMSPHIYTTYVNGILGRGGGGVGLLTPKKTTYK